MGSRSGIALRGLGDDFMSVLALAAGALAGNRFRPEPGTTAIHEITVRFDDDTTRILRIAGGPDWRRGDHVRVIQGRIFARD